MNFVSLDAQYKNNINNIDNAVLQIIDTAGRLDEEVKVIGRGRHNNCANSPML